MSALPRDGQGEGPQVAVIPVGEAAGFLPAATVADAVVRRLNRDRPRSARLYHPLPPSPLEHPSDAAAHASLTKAHASFDALDFDQVRRHAQNALGDFRLVIEAGGSTSGYVDTLHLIAATELFDDRLEEARRSMRNAIVFDTSAPSLERYNPAVQTLHQDALGAHRGALQLTSEPPALVWIDGRLRGPTGRSHALRPGLHWVRIFRPGYSPWLDWVELHPGQSQALSAILQEDSLTTVAELDEIRTALRQPSPTAAIARIIKTLSAKQLIVIYAGDRCEESPCTLMLRSARNERWEPDRLARYTEGQADAVAASLLGRAGPPGGLVQAAQGDGGQPCQLDSDCGYRDRCVGGRCERVRPLTQRWWFWTIIAAATAGVAAGVIIPLSMPDSPVIDVR